jgi:hypothetical protein
MSRVKVTPSATADWADDDPAPITRATPMSACELASRNIRRRVMGIANFPLNGNEAVPVFVDRTYHADLRGSTARRVGITPQPERTDIARQP